MRGSSYLGSTPKSALSRPRRFGSLAAILMVFAVMLSTFATIPVIDSLMGSRNEAISSASAMWCADPKQGELGVGMNSKSNWNGGSSRYVHDDTSGRILTAQEAFGNGVKFTNFAGAGEGQDWLFGTAPLGLPEKDDDKDEKLKSVVSYTGNTPKGEGTENWYKNMNSSRVPTKCVLGGAGTLMASGILGLSGSITNLMGGISTFAFDPSFICEPNEPQGNCIDLVGIIGGAGKSDQGIIGKLTTSVYFPLLALVALLVGVYIIWNGLAKRQFRETFLGVIWAVVVTILGIGLLLNPLLLAKAPMVVGNALTSCIVGAFSGSGGCADNSGGSGSSDPQTALCEAWSSKTDFVDKASITMTSMGCQLWKAFVLQPYAQGAFGAPLDELDTSRADTIAGKLIAKNPGFDKTTFCVDTKVKGKLDSHYGNTLDLTKSGAQICNLAVYQAYLGVNAKMDSGAGGNPPAAGAIDARWLKVAQLASTDEGMYRSWAPSDMHLAQIGYASLGLLSAFLAAIVVFVISAFALAFYVTSILMLAFSPFFLLAGVHPGKGKKMMLGWIGQVLSNVMKYAASAIFLVITVSLYSATLANVTNPGAILIFMIILTVALLMYRKEIVDMIGVIDLGGEKLSNKFGDWTRDRLGNVGKTAMAVGAGVTAGALSNGALNPMRKENWTVAGARRNLGDSFRAGNDSFRRSIKSRPGMLGEVMKASDRISADNRADMVRQSTAVSKDAQAADRELANAKKQGKDLASSFANNESENQARIDGLRVESQAAERSLVESDKLMVEVAGAEDTALAGVSSDAFRQYQDLVNQLRDLKIQANIAFESGDTEGAERLRASAAGVASGIESARAEMSDQEFAAGRRQYRALLAENIEDPMVSEKNAESHANQVAKVYGNDMSTIARTARQAAEVNSEKSRTEADLNSKIAQNAQRTMEAQRMAEKLNEAADVARQEVIDLKPGQPVTNKSVRDRNKRIDEIRNREDEDQTAASSLIAASEQGNPVRTQETASDLLAQAQQRPRTQSEAQGQVQEPTAQPQPASQQRATRGLPPEAFSAPTGQAETASEARTEPLRRDPVAPATPVQQDRVAPVAPTQSPVAPTTPVQAPVTPVAPGQQAPAQQPADTRAGLPRPSAVEDQRAAREAEARAGDERRAAEARSQRAAEDDRRARTAASSQSQNDTAARENENRAQRQREADAQREAQVQRDTQSRREAQAQRDAQESREADERRQREAQAQQRDAAAQRQRETDTQNREAEARRAQDTRAQNDAQAAQRQREAEAQRQRDAEAQSQRNADAQRQQEARDQAQAQRQQEAESLRRQNAENARAQAARETAEARVRSAADESVRQANRSADDMIQEIGQERDNLRSKVQHLVAGSNTGNSFQRVLAELDRVTNDRNISEAELRSKLEAISAETENITERFSSLVGGQLGDDVRGLRDDIDSQVERVRSLRDIRDADGGQGNDGPQPPRNRNPFRSR